MAILTRHDSIGASHTENGQVVGIYRKCPHCGMVDRQYSAQGANQSHHQITRVGAVLRYECGKCRKQFFAVEVCVPATTTPHLLYDKIRRLLSKDSPAEGGRQ